MRKMRKINKQAKRDILVGIMVDEHLPSSIHHIVLFRQSSPPPSSPQRPQRPQR